MIRSVRDKRVLQIIAGKSPKRFPADLLRVTERRLKYLADAKVLDDLKCPPGNRLEALSGDRSGQYSIRINRQWRICFRWPDDAAEDVEIVDYHGGQTMKLRFANPIHPGEMLREEFMAPLGLTAGKLARALGVPRTRIERLVREETAITADTAARLGRYFGTSAEIWMNFQASFELDRFYADETRLAEIEAIKPAPRPDLGEAA